MADARWRRTDDGADFGAHGAVHAARHPALSQCLDSDLPEIGLLSLMRLIRYRIDLPLIVDPGVMQRYQGSAETVIAVASRGMSLGSILTHVLPQHGLDWTIHEDAVLVAPAAVIRALGNRITTRVYVVATIVGQAADASWLLPDQLPIVQLMEHVRALVDPESWDDRGGSGTMRQWGARPILLVRQTARNQEILGTLLHELEQACSRTDRWAGLPAA